MFTFFQCIAEAVGVKGLRSLAKEIPLGSTLVEIASEAWKRYRQRKAEAAARAELQQIVQAAVEDVKKAAVEASRAAFPTDPEKAVELELYLTQIPSTIRQSLRRSDDPSGTTVPPAFTFNKPEDLLPLLPTRVSRFRPGDGLPGRDGWTLSELLGTGGFGEVWLASHPHFASLRRAVKFCLELSDQDRTLLYEGGLIDRVMRAGPIANVAALIDANLAGESPWLMYEYVSGGDLVSLVAGWKRHSHTDRHQRALGAIRQIAAAVGHFHKLGVVHRDIKPSNVLVEPAKGDTVTLKVVDFGIGGLAARHELATDTRRTISAVRDATVARGAFTPIYASPQQKKGSAPDPRDDVFALAVMGYQLLCGDVTAERPAGKGWRRGLQNQGVKPAVLDVLENAWDDDPTERPRDASELLAKLNAALKPPKAPEPDLPFASEMSSIKAPPPKPKAAPIPAAPRPNPPVVPQKPPEEKPQEAGTSAAGCVLLLLIAGGIGVGIYNKNQEVAAPPNNAPINNPGLTPPKLTPTPPNTKDSPEAIRNWAFSERLRGKWLPDKGSEGSPIRSITITPSRYGELREGQEERLGGSIDLNVNGKDYYGNYWINSTNEKQFTLSFSAVDDRGVTQVRDIQVSELGTTGLQLRWEPYKYDPTFDGGPTQVYRERWPVGEKLKSALIGGTWTAQDNGVTYSFAADLRATRNGVPGVFNFTEDDTIEVLIREGHQIATRRYRFRYLGPNRIETLLVRDTTNPSFVEDAARNSPWIVWTRNGAKAPEKPKEEKKADAKPTN